MPNTTTYDFGDVVLVPFPFAENRILNKKRAAVVISSSNYNAEGVVLGQTDRLDLLIVMGITSIKDALGTVSIKQWSEAGLLHPSFIKPVIATFTPDDVIKQLGKLTIADVNKLKRMLLRVLNLTPSSPTAPTQQP